MEIKGKVIAILALQEGTGKKGQWFKQEFVIETLSQYPKKVCISLWNKVIGEAALVEGEIVTAHIDIESREYNGRYYTEVKGWTVEHEDDFDPTAKSQSEHSTNDDNQLPF